MISPQISIPFDILARNREYVVEHRLNLEVFLSAGVLDEVSPDDVARELRALPYHPSITLHAPFMDLCPGAVDSKAREFTQGRFRQVFDVARAVQPMGIVFHSGYEKWKYAHKVETWLSASLKLWPEFVQMASDLGLYIAIENIFEDEPGNLVQLMAALDSPNVGVCFDAGHFNLFSRVELRAWLDALGPRIKEVHLHDNAGGYDSHLAIGEGSFDFSGFFKLLGKREVVYTLEAHTPERVQKSLVEFKRLIKAFRHGCGS